MAPAELKASIYRMVVLVCSCWTCAHLQRPRWLLASCTRLREMCAGSVPILRVSMRDTARAASKIIFEEYNRLFVGSDTTQRAHEHLEGLK